MTDQKKIEEDCLYALAEARALIRNRAPYFQTVVYGFVLRFAPGVMTLGVTKSMVLVIDPWWFTEGILKTVVATYERDSKAPPKGDALKREAAEMRAALLLHEAGHWLRGLDRIHSMPDPNLANIAFDIPNNHDLREAGWKLPFYGVFPETFGFEPGLTGEQYYALLEQQGASKCRKKLPVAGVSDGSGGSGGAGGGGNNPGRDDADGDQSGSGGPSSDSRGQVAAGRCGSCAGGSLGKIEESLNQEAGRTEADCTRIRKAGIEDLRQAATGPGRGTVPQSLLDLLDHDKQPPSVIPWRQQLSKVIRRCAGRIVSGMADFSMRRPSRRSQVRGVIRPSMIDRRPEVVFIEDSSGSMGEEQLLAARAEACGVFLQLGLSEAWFMDADAGVAAKPKRIRLKDLKTMGVHGRGGTDFRPGIAKALTLQPKPDICIYLTDGDGVAPPTPPKGMEVVWCIVPTSYGRRPANWGHLVVVSDDQQLRQPYLLTEDDDEEEDYDY